MGVERSVLVEFQNFPGRDSRATMNTDLSGAEPNVPHVVADGLGGRHGAGQLPGLDDGGAALLHRLREEDEGVWKEARSSVSRHVQERALTEMKSPLSQASSFTASYAPISAPCTSTLAWCTSGYWVDEWLPQMMTFFTLSEPTSQRIATCRTRTDTATYYKSQGLPSYIKKIFQFRSYISHLLFFYLKP